MDYIEKEYKSKLNNDFIVDEQEEIKYADLVNEVERFI